jgi:hypothetical protein
LIERFSADGLLWYSYIPTDQSEQKVLMVVGQKELLQCRAEGLFRSRYARKPIDQSEQKVRAGKFVAVHAEARHCCAAPELRGDCTCAARKSF